MARKPPDAGDGALVSGMVPIAAPAATTMPFRGPRDRSRSCSDVTVSRVKVAAPPVATASCRHASHSALQSPFSAVRAPTLPFSAVANKRCPSARTLSLL